jgi:TRAP-type transport system small permease protein
LPLPSPAGPQSIWLRIANGIDGVIDKVCQGILLITGTVLMFALPANVLARYVLATGGFDWAEEVPEQLFPWFIMAGVALAVQHLGHVAVEWLLGMVDSAKARIVLIGGHVLVIATYVLLANQALTVADIVSIERSPVLGLPKTYGYWAIAAGSALVALSTVAGTLRLCILGLEGHLRPPKPEATA